ncbi:MAG TPA: S41 family peptidase [Bryobacteraceae bacterium]|nr:S41 family peptidase [Bryobacteraceae bacterium]
MRPLLPAFLVAAALAFGQDLETELRRFTQVYAVLEREAADPVDPDEAIYGGAIPSMLRPLDPHSVFLNPDQFEQLQRLQESVSKGFGSVVSVLPGRVIVLQTLPGTPSAKAGLAPGDEIVAVNGIPLGRLTLEQLIGLLGEARRKPARLDIRRPGSVRTLEFVLTPEDMQNPSVERAFFLRPGVGYIRVTSFDAQTSQDLNTAVEKLGGGALKGLVLDLRDNPGGLLPAALETASLFLRPGQLLLTVSGRAVAGHKESVPDDARPYTFPLAVLINEKSASAAEIVAGCLQDHDRASIIGTPSFGKGLVETVYPLSDGAGLALTTAFYYTPSGRSIQKPLSSGQIATPAREVYRTDGGRIVQGGGGIQPDHVVRDKPLTRLQAFLQASGSFTTFATEYLRSHGAVPSGFEATAEVLDEFRAFLSARKILPGVAEWSEVRGWTENRLKTEIFNQAFGVPAGDEVEVQQDAAVLAAIKTLNMM